jgi:uncharacterized membrane protein
MIMKHLTARIAKFLAPLTLGCALVASLAQKPAHADLKFVNYYSQTVWVAVGWHDENSCGSFDPWRAKGWYRVDRGQTVTAMYGDLAPNRYWYFYAMSEDRTYIWEGEYDFFANADAAFDICDTPGPGVDKLYFRQLDLNGIHDYTYPLY